MKEGIEQFRQEKANKLRFAKHVDPELAKEMLAKLKNNPEYINAENEYRKEPNPGLEAHREKLRASKSESDLHNDELLKKAREQGRTEDPEENKRQAIAELRAEIEKIPQVYGEGGKVETSSVSSAVTENNEKMEESPDVKLFRLLSTDKSIQEKFPVYNEDATRVRELQKQLHDTVEGVKSLFKQEYKQGFSLQEFYDRHNFFASDDRIKEQNEKNMNVRNVHATINYNPGKEDLYSKKLWNEVLDEKFGTDKIRKDVEKAKTTYHVADWLKDKRKHNINSVELELSLDSEKTGDKERSFMGISTGTKKVRTEFSTLSESAKLAIAKRFGAVEEGYSGPLKQHKNFGSDEINRAGHEFTFQKFLPLPNIKGAAIEIDDYRTHNNGYKDPKCKTKLEFNKQAIKLVLSKEFFDEILKKEMVK